MIEIGQHVRIGEGGVSVFEVLEIEEGFARIESIQDAPGRYPFLMPLEALHRAE